MSRSPQRSVEARRPGLPAGGRAGLPRQPRKNQLGPEVAYDTSEVTVEGPDYPYSKDVKPYEFVVSLFVAC